MAEKRIFTEEEKQLIINMYNDGETYKVIGQTLHTKAETISKILKSLGYGKRRKNTLKNHSYLSASRKNKLNEDYFENIDTEDKAYWLGFLYADGYVRKNHDNKGNEKGGSLELALKIDDRYHIQNFLCDIGSTAPISEKIIRYNGKEYKAAKTVVSSIKLVNDLISHGCVQNKSLILTRPNTIPENLIRHFVRGYFDGDGCVGFYPEKYTYKYSILGTKDLLEFIAQSSNIESYTIRRYKNENCYELITYSKKSAETFHNYIYDDKTIYLERKYQKSLGMMKYCEMEDARNDTQKMADLIDCSLIFNDELLSDFTAHELKKTERSETAAMADLLD